MVKIQHWNKRTSNPVRVPIKESTYLYSMKCDVMISNEISSTIITDRFCWILSSTLCLLLINRSANTSHMASLWWQVVVTVDVTTCIWKRKKKRKNGGFVLSWSIGNNAYFSLRLGSEFCWQALLFISNLIQRRNDPLFLSLYYTVPVHMEVSFAVIPQHITYTYTCTCQTETSTLAK